MARIRLEQNAEYYLVDVEGNERTIRFSLEKGKTIEFVGDAELWNHVYQLLRQIHLNESEQIPR